ncbi:MAG: twin-arginine translocase subunit TatC [Nitrospinae bacterium]|nr:twin-arginine translocase subunit TatC [Nitrospinota bacterium]
MSDEKPAKPQPAGEQTGNLYSRKRVVRKVAPEEKLPFTVHLEELRWRLVYCIITVGVTFTVLYALSEGLFQMVRAPLGTDLVFLAPAEAFFVYLKISLYAAVFISMPMILYQIWEFVAPGLLGAERRYTGYFVVFGTVFFVVGAAFCYFAVLPFGLQFLIGYGGEGLKPMISVSEYISFLFLMTIAFGLVFELPVVILFMVRMGLVTPDWLARQRPYFVVLAFIVGAILTPPDVFSQVVMAVPMLILYEGSIIAARLMFPAKKKESAGD